MHYRIVRSCHMVHTMPALPREILSLDWRDISRSNNVEAQRNLFIASTDDADKLRRPTTSCRFFTLSIFWRTRSITMQQHLLYIIMRGREGPQHWRKKDFFLRDRKYKDSDTQANIIYVPSLWRPSRRKKTNRLSLSQTWCYDQLTQLSSVRNTWMW